MKLARIIFILAAAALTSCFTDKEDKVILLVNCSEQSPKSGQIVKFDIETFTTDNSRLSELRIKSFDTEHGTLELETIPVSVKRFEYSYLYTVPAFREKDTPLELNFVSQSESGNVQSVIMKFTISSSQLLAERSGITLYSPQSGHPDAFSLRMMQPVSTAESDDEDIDIYIPGSDDENTLARALRSKTNIRFSRANNFNYSSATAFSLNETYASSIRYNSIEGLEMNDVILFGRDDTALGVMKIVAITDETGSSNDCIILNIKAIE